MGAKIMTRVTTTFSYILSVMVFLLSPLPSMAAPSFEGKVIDVHVSSAPGGALDLYARTYARHVSRYLPGNPTMVPRNVPGAGGIMLANQVASTLPRDGTAVAALTNGLYLSQLLGVRNVEYDASQFNWIGRMAPLPLLLVSSERSGVRSLEDLRRQKGFSVSVTGPGSYGYLVLSAIKNIAGIDLQIISGYRSGGENRLAMERGEVHGTASVQWTVQSQQDWFRNINANILAQIALTPYADLPQVPLLGALATDEESKQILVMFVAPAEIGRGFALPPGVPDDIIAVHRNAFLQMTRDEAFLSDANRQTLEIDALDGESLQRVVFESGNVSPQAISRARAAVE